MSAVQPATTQRLNGCHNRPLLDNSKTYTVQDGYHSQTLPDGQPMRTAPRWVEQTGFTSFPGCVYDKNTVDPACTGCYLAALQPDGVTPR